MKAIRILLADDHTMIRSGLRALLERQPDFQVIGEAADGHEAVEMAEKASPDVVDDECRGLLEAARRLNEVNRQVRNLIAANVAARIDAIVGSPALYRAPAYAYAGVR